jgi:ATP-binding cassette subfamily C (CFTR/MRP) protein 1
MLLSSSAKRVSTVGEMVNLMSENSQIFKDLFLNLNLLWNAPIQIIICITLLWKYIGVASLAGLATMLTLLPINAFLSNKTKSLHKKRCKLQDSRIKITNEAFSTIKVVKLYAWEMSFNDILSKIKSDELVILSKIGVLNSIAAFSAVSVPFLVAAVSFATFILIDEKNVLDSNTAFVSLSLFNIMKYPLANSPHMISSLIQVYFFSIIDFIHKI